MTEKQEIREILCQNLLPVFDGMSIDDAITYLKELKSKSEGSFLRLSIEVDGMGEYEDYREFLLIYGVRLEAQEEYDKRILKEKTKQEKQLARKRAKREKLRQQLAQIDTEIGDGS